ncbi:MAG: zinc carboxypeptidase [Deltaproteobacteria bacterium]|nr:zinc carboxypeptidase [Deltaproteobacteria bacterium]MBI3293155.1 zinc carboxypeptidase [Deltaproteobacteria bacterium]
MSVFGVLTLWAVSAFGQASDTMLQAKIFAANRVERTRVGNSFAIDMVLPDYVVVTAPSNQLEEIKKLGFAYEVLKSRGFPEADKEYHTYAQTNDELDALVKEFPGLVQKVTIGKSLEGRAMNGVRISSSSLQDSLPTAIFVGCHHAREHLSVEVPLRLARHLAANYSKDGRIKGLLDSREVWIVPMVNPDGAEYDISTGSYKWWRKNRKNNGNSTYGVDLNRNYGAYWGGEGSSGSPSSDTYRGTSAFSEPETQAVRDFVRARKHATVLLTFHTFSELILWPWGYRDESISDEKDRNVFETMGKKMATWNHYTPEKSSELYLTSGDTTDWAYDELKIFAFTFELSPSSLGGGGFYPGASVIDPVVKDNIEPALYLIENSKDPYAVVGRSHIDPLGIL